MTSPDKTPPSVVLTNPDQQDTRISMSSDKATPAESAPSGDSSTLGSSSNPVMLRYRKSTDKNRGRPPKPSVELKRVEVDMHVKRDISNTTDFRWNEVFQITGSVVPAIYIRVTWLTLWATLWTVLYKVVNFRTLAISNQLIGILSVVMGLLLVFRTNTAYDRYWEARRLWGTMFTHLRNLARFVWISVEIKDDSDIRQRYGVMNLLLAFPIATKHFLRDEFGIHYEDLYHLLNHLPDYAPGSKHADIQNLPLDITFYISSFTKRNRDQNRIDVPTASNMMTAVSGLVDVLSNVERIRNSPIPFAYFLHLRQTLLVYLILLPFQLLATMEWITIPVCAVASFTLLGIESIGGEIENPFGYDRNDLDLDSFCDQVHEELEQIMNRPSALDPGNWTDPVRIDDYGKLFVPGEQEKNLSPVSAENSK